MKTSFVTSAFVVASALAAAPAHGQPVTPLARGEVDATVTLEENASASQLGDVSSIAPDLSTGVTDDITLSLIHSTYGRTGFRGVAGAGLCAGDGCAATYDNVGVEGLIGLHSGGFTISANPGIHALSIDDGFYAAKLGLKLRGTRGRVAWNLLPSYAVALSHRGPVPENPDRFFLPFELTVDVTSRVLVGALAGGKTAVDDPEGTYELSVGAMAEVAVARDIAIGASWVHGQLLAGNVARPNDMSGIDSRALQIWLTARR
jgi:hypothetical protein